MNDIFSNNDPQWYKDAIIYEVHIKSFFDNNQSGMGDFKGLTDKLEYLEELGITALWILPFYPSPLRDDGYDIADYLDINPDYGTLQDFKDFLKQAHKHNIRVITELVLNHTSDQHAWFQRSRKAAPGTNHRDFYVWNDSPEKYQDARIIFKDFETSNWTWDAEAGAYYWHRFYSHQPDLNFENPNVQKELIKSVDYWLSMGVDGLRLDAVPYLFEEEGTNCENLDKTHGFLRRIRAHVDKKYPDKMFLAEANQWPEDAVEYFGDGDECHMAFNFPIMPRIFMSIQMEDRFPIIDIVEQTPDIPDNAQWALFLRNHDELTLEMVTDEERDYMYRVYAQDPRSRINLGIRRRLAPLLGNDRQKIELANILLFSLPGTPVIYYGDEIGMGDNYYLGDRDGVRTPMQWTPDRNAGFSMVNPQKLYLPVVIDPEYHFESINVENQKGNTSSLYWWMKKLIAIRKKYPTLGRGEMEFLVLDNPKVLAFSRTFNDQTMIIVINLSRLSQVAEIDFSSYLGYTPREVFSQNLFPSFKEEPYILTLGPHGYFWFILEQDNVNVQQEVHKEGILTLKGSWHQLLKGVGLDILEQKLLPHYLPQCVWYQGRGRNIREVIVKDIVKLGNLSGNSHSYHLLIMEVHYLEGQHEYYQMAISFEADLVAERLVENTPQCLIARLHTLEGEGILYDAVYSPELRQILINSFAKNKKIVTSAGQMQFQAKASVKKATTEFNSTILKQDRHNTSFLFSDEYFLKMYRRIDNDINPEVEVIRQLSKKTKDVHTPDYLGQIDYSYQGGSFTLGLLERNISHESDGWVYSLDMATRFFDQLLSRRVEFQDIPPFPDSLVNIDWHDIPVNLKELTDTYYFEFSHLVGKRTAEMHLVLASVDDPAFKPEPFSQLYQRSLYQSMQGKVRRMDQTLRHKMSRFPEELQSVFRNILAHKDRSFEIMKKVSGEKIPGKKIRIHNEYHLGQILYTGKDVSIIDFEGHPDTALSERRLKRTVMRDVVGMVRSFHYVVYHALLNHPSVAPEDLQVLISWAELWYAYVSGIFLHSYLDTIASSGILPMDAEVLEPFFDAFMLESMFDELEYHLEVDERFVIIPIQGINRILDQD